MTGGGGMPGPLTGQVLAIASAAAFACANNFISRTSRSDGDKGVTFSVLVTMGISALLWLLLEASDSALPRSRGEWLAVGWFAIAGILAMVFGRTLVFESIRRLGVTRSTAVKRLNPFFTVLLAACFLGEAVTLADALGMVAIGGAFVLLVQGSLRRPGGLGDAAPPPSSYLFGVFGALAYAAAYIGRKAGLDAWPVPALGTFLSAATGFIAFAAMAVVLPRRKAHFAGMFRHLDRWIVASAIMVSLGQILLFTALAFEKVSTVVMVASLEIFISIFLSVVVFRNERAPGPSIAVAAGLATLGVVLVAAN